MYVSQNAYLELHFNDKMIKIKVFSTIHELIYMYSVNQLLFATTLFCDLPEMNWFGATNFPN